MERKEDTELLFARIDDLFERAERGETAVSVFLSPRELHFARRRLEERRASFLAFGGMTDAERQRIYILPEYMEGVTSVSEFILNIPVIASADWVEGFNGGPVYRFFRSFSSNSSTKSHSSPPLTTSSSCAHLV